LTFNRAGRLTVEKNSFVIIIEHSFFTLTENVLQVSIMKIRLKCFAALANLDACDYKDSTEYRLDEGQTVEDLVQLAGISREDVKIAFVNNRIVEFDTVLTDGDQVGLAPAVGGM
jgi:molybdopterin converting factor small subunit